LIYISKSKEISNIKTPIKKESTANRGMDLEKILSDKCKEYYRQGIACIVKVPTDWTVQRAGAKIVSAFPKSKSISDYIGAYNGIPIAIEAKRTTNENSFPFDNVKEHQWEFFEKFCKQGKGYYIVWFKTLNKAFLVEAMLMQHAKDTLGRKSARIEWFEQNTILLDNNMDFLKHLN
jgi:recombination protein U